MCHSVLSFPSGRELTQGHQLGLAGAVSLPVFWLAGAGTAVFWVLGEYIIKLCNKKKIEDVEDHNEE